MVNSGGWRVHQRCKSLDLGRPLRRLIQADGRELKEARCWCGNVEVELHELAFSWLRRMKRMKLGFWLAELGRVWSHHRVCDMMWGEESWRKGRWTQIGGGWIWAISKTCKMVCEMTVWSLMQSWRQINYSLKENERTWKKETDNKGYETRWQTKTKHKCKSHQVLQRFPGPLLLKCSEGTQDPWKPAKSGLERSGLRNASLNHVVLLLSQDFEDSHQEAGWFFACLSGRLVPLVGPPSSKYPGATSIS